MSLRTLIAGRGLVESPRWHDGRLYFSDWTAGEVLAAGPDGTTEVVARVAGLPLCTAFLPDGRLLIVDSPHGTLLAATPGGTPVHYADLGRPGWNDIVADGRGNAYVNRAGFNPMAGEPVRPGFVHVVRPDGTLAEVAGDIAFPNGMAVTPDNHTLIVADSYRHQLVAFAIGDDGGLSDRRVFADLGDAAPDGICLDAEGAVWYADVPHRRCVRVAEGGEVLATVAADRGCFACVLGGHELYVVAAEWNGMASADLVVPGSGQVLVTEVDVPGAGWP